jgi:hypothetical protein
MFHGFGTGVPSSSARWTHLGQQTCVTRKDPPNGSRAYAGLLEKVCVVALDRPPKATYYARTTGDSTRVPDGIVHFRELLAILSWSCAASSYA